MGEGYGVLVLVCCCALMALTAGAAAAAAGLGAPRGAAASSRPRVAPYAGSVPPVFASADEGPSGSRTELQLRAAQTGRVVDRLGSFGMRFTNNGLALAPDGRSVYFTLIPTGKRISSLLLERITVGVRRPTLRVAGEQPAVSPDGRLLAYTTDAPHAQSIRVRDLVTGLTRTVDISAPIGHDGDLLNASVAWLADSRTIVVLPGEVATPASRSATAAARIAFKRRSARALAALIVIAPNADGRLVARRVLVHGLDGSPDTIYTAAASPGSVIASSLVADTCVLDAISLSGRSAVVSRIVAIKAAQVVALDPSGRRLLYIQGHRPPALWAATLAPGRLIDRHRLFRDNPTDESAW